MSKYSWSDLKNLNITDGSEYSGEPIPGVRISHLNCEYCGVDIIGVWDKHNIHKWYPYLGTQLERGNIYSYSKIILAIKEYYGIGQYDRFRQEDGNNLLNVHARFHSIPNKWHYRASKASTRMLCNNCFKETYNRWKIELPDGTIAALSVVRSRGETLMSVAEDLGIHDYKVIGRGAVDNY